MRIRRLLCPLLLAGLLAGCGTVNNYIGEYSRGNLAVEAKSTGPTAAEQFGLPGDAAGPRALPIPPIPPPHVTEKAMPIPPRPPRNVASLPFPRREVRQFSQALAAISESEIAHLLYPYGQLLHGPRGTIFAACPNGEKVDFTDRRGRYRLFFEPSDLQQIFAEIRNSRDMRSHLPPPIAAREQCGEPI